MLEEHVRSKSANDETGNGYYYCNYCHFINLFFKVYK